MTKFKYLIKEKVIFPDIVLFIIYISCLFTINIFNLRPLVSLIVLILLVILWFDDNFYLVLPIFIFFNAILILPLNIKVFDIYSVMFLIKLIISKKMSLKTKYIIPLFILIIFSVGIGLSNNLRVSIIVIVSSLFVMLYLSNYLVDDFKISNFLIKFIYASIISSIFGLINLTSLNSNYILVNGLVTSITRNIGSFTDPNYFGFFVNVSIFILITTKLEFNRISRYLIIVFLYISLLSTISLTAIICNLIGVFLVILIYRKNRIRFFVLVLVALFILIQLWDYILLSNIPVLNDFILRILSLNLGKNEINLDILTTSRSIIWSTHWGYFINQPMFNILFGGNFITDYGFSSSFKSVSHQVHLDMLLNFGFIGTLILNGSFIFYYSKVIKNYIITKNKYLLTIIFIKYTWLFYSFGLSMFPAWIFNIFFFL